ncbi:metallophosphoesterase [Psychrobacillus sp.]|uniref:metallophosphoesterase family protein n=1 Tax=Psychrobacillus sp. TaxID=1871623 RepID=UPI0028BD83A7|nr:metallophosphoesterase [Psychrobacillus sp.]
MKLLVMSDTHSDIETMERVMHRHLDVDAFIHCGDSELDYSYFENGSIHVVQGNCDFDFNFPTEVITQVGNETIYVAHGHLHQVKSTLMPLSYRAAEVRASLVCFGHSHLLGAEMHKNVLYVNPGSLHLPRGRKEKSYAIVEKLEKEWHVTFFSSEYELLESASFTLET